MPAIKLFLFNFDLPFIAGLFCRILAIYPWRAWLHSMAAIGPSGIGLASPIVVLVHLVPCPAGLPGEILAGPPTGFHFLRSLRPQNLFRREIFSVLVSKSRAFFPTR